MKVFEKKMKTINTFLGIIEFHLFGQVIRTPITLLTSSIQPVSFIFLLTVVAGFQIVPVAVVGAIVYFATSYGLADLPIELSGIEKRSKFKQIYVASPIHPLIFIFASAIGINMASFPQLIVLIIMYAIFFKITIIHLPALILIILLLWVWSSTTGFYLFTKLRNPLPLMRFTNLLVMITTVLLPIYYPVEIIPQSYRIFTLMFPTSGAAYLLRNLTNPSWIYLKEGFIAISSLCIISLIFTLISIKKSEWREQ